VQLHSFRALNSTLVYLRPHTNLASRQGRSAFEVTDQSAIPPPPLPPPPQNAHAQRLPPSPPSPLRYYIQQHDSRGHPINPASRDLGRALREAQNDVLAAIGVVERRASPLDEDEINALCRKIDILDTMEKENRAGDVAASLFTLGEVCATWWVGSLRDRVLVSVVVIWGTWRRG
jgi:hypothetical protein